MNIKVKNGKWDIKLDMQNMRTCSFPWLSIIANTRTAFNYEYYKGPYEIYMHRDETAHQRFIYTHHPLAWTVQSLCSLMHNCHPSIFTFTVITLIDVQPSQMISEECTQSINQYKHHIWCFTHSFGGFHGHDIELTTPKWGEKTYSCLISWNGNPAVH